jgi:hyperosmotically inducible periplasmic protein
VEVIVKGMMRVLGGLVLLCILSAGAVAETAGAARYDAAIQAKAAERLAQKQEFHKVQASVEDGIVTLSGEVALLQQKLDAAKSVRKADHVQGVRNLIAVSTTVPDGELAAQLQRKLYYDRIGYDNLFNFVSVSVKDGVATLDGETVTYPARDSAVAIASYMPGVKDLVDNIKVAPASGFDDSIRIRAVRAIYRDSVLGRYGADPARPIRIVVDNGHLTLYGTVDSTMDKEIAGMRASQVFGAFSVQNDLRVSGKS